MTPSSRRISAVSATPRIALREALRFEAYFIAACASAGVLLALTGLDLGWVFTLALLPYLGRNLFYLNRLARLILRHHRLVPPFPRGVWGEIYRAIAQYQQRGRKRRKRQLRFTRRFREAALSVPDALVILDKQKRIEWGNPASAPLMDVQWPRDSGKRLTEILRHPQLGEFIDAGEYSRPLEIAPEHNRTITLSLRITPFGERKRQRLIVARDITKVYHLNVIRRDFVANASHELRTPLTVIAGFLENLTDSPLTPEQHRRPLELMINQTARMRSIIDDLLTLSRLEMADRSEEVGPADVPDELGLIIHEAQVLSGGRHRFLSHIDPNLLIVGNQLELRSAFSNLVFNAVKHTPEGSCIRVTWQEEGRSAVFSVEDDGDGIPPEHIPRLTERFYRIDRARSRASGGTGLGLAIVNHVLNRHDAQLIIASEVGEGCTFSCRFPDTSILWRARLQEPPRRAVGSDGHGGVR
jgi:two-component system phosphate regulon sensor histidine kinase PhoR